MIAWLAAQPWCSGAVGMMGISWGGFNALQVAARRPPALKAIISMCSTDDRYANDEHYIGGCVMGPEMQSYATMLLGYATHAPDPAVVGDGWRELWRERLEAAAPALPEWLAHQRRDAYWRHGSVCEDWDAMECAVYMVGGWADGYRDAILRVLENYRGPVKGLIGPWCHTSPHHGEPGPAIGFLQEALRWWDHWLKGVDTGVMDDPALTFWMQDAYTRGEDMEREDRPMADGGRRGRRRTSRATSSRSARPGSTRVQSHSMETPHSRPPSRSRRRRRPASRAAAGSPGRATPTRLATSGPTTAARACSTRRR